MSWTGVRTSEGGLRVAVVQNGEDEGSFQVIFSAGNIVQYCCLAAPIVQGLQDAIKWRAKT